MAVNSIFNSLTFGGINSLDYGIYITGEAVYNAPERAVEKIAIPGRSGDLIIDQGRWENIPVTYPAGCFGDDQSEFAAKISAFRNAIISQLGYQRLTDTYNPDEYRLGSYLSGLDVEPKAGGKAGEFDIVFDCKPERWLLEGETEETITSGQDLINPTLFASSPLLMAKGSGHISLNGFDIDIIDQEIGDVKVAESATGTGDYIRVDIDPTSINSGDELTIGKVAANLTFAVKNPSNWKVTAVSEQSHTGDGHASLSFNANGFYATITLPSLSVASDTSGSLSGTWVLRGTLKSPDGTSTTYPTPTINVSVSYATTGRITVHVTVTGTINPTALTKSTTLGDTKAYSTRSSLGNPTYIDCDLGECYKIQNGKYISLNQSIVLGSKLPVLASGANEITFDNTITELKIIPRWWQL